MVAELRAEIDRLASRVADDAEGMAIVADRYRASVAEVNRLTAQAARFDAEWALQVDGLTVASGSEQFVREGGFDHSGPGHAIVRRLVGPWCEVKATEPDTESGAA